MNNRLKIFVLPLAFSACIAGGPASAQIYRCDEGDTRTFSDVPCSENAEVYESRLGISVVSPAGDLNDVAQRNKAFIEQRQERLATIRKRAAERRLQDELIQQRRAATTEQVRYPIVIGQLAGSSFGSVPRGQTDPRLRAQQQEQAAEEDPQRRRTLLSRSGGNRPRILR